MYPSYESIKKNLEEKNSKGGSVTLTADQKSHIDSVAWEIAGLYSELKRSDEHLEKQIEERLNPEKKKRPIPFDRVVQMFPDDTEGIKELGQKESFQYRISDDDSRNTYFSPLYDTKLFNAKIKYRVGQAGIYENGAKLDIKAVQPIHKSICWLGIELSDNLENLNGLSLYFNWDNTNENYGELLKLVTIALNEIKLPTQTGVIVRNQEIPIDFHETLWMRNIVEEPCFVKSKSSFLSILDLDVSANNEIDTSRIITSSEHPINTEKLLWLKLACPFEIDEHILQNIKINCFPALNRKYIHQSVVLSEPLQIVPLTLLDKDGNKNAFLCLDRIYSTATTYQPIIGGSIEAAPAGSYSFERKRIDISNLEDFRFHIQDWLRRAQRENNLIWRVFHQNRKDIKKILENINKSFGELTDLLISPKASEEHYFVYLKRENNSNENLWVGYWVITSI